MEKISVAVRVRPLKPEGRCSSGNSGKGKRWRILHNTIALCNPSSETALVHGHTFAFDHVFGTEAKNHNVYDVHAKEVIEAALNGFNGTVFAYGQTSSGKTYTMHGSPSDPGLIRMAIHHVFAHIHQVDAREYLIRVSYMEIYNEEINDLLAPENRKLQIHENLERGVFVAGLREEIVNSPEQVFELLNSGEVHRHFGETNMNLHSSRSHTIFRMVIESKIKTHGTEASVAAIRVSVLNLIDLAGSERVSKSGAGGIRLKEGTHINKSLLTLATVIKKLSDGGGAKQGHIPYRDSKLTRILQPALGGNAKTAIICTISPDEANVDESRGTLQFASRAKRVTTCAEVNEILTDAALLRRQKKQIEELLQKLQGSHSEILEQEILRLRNDLLKFELEKEKLALELQEERKAQLERERRIKEQEQRIENLSTLVTTTTSASSDHEQERLSQQEKTKMIRDSEQSFNNMRITLRRENLPAVPSFDKLVDGSAECTEEEEEEEEGGALPSDFSNIADEDTWSRLNEGYETEPDFLFSTPISSNTPLTGSGKQRRRTSFIRSVLQSSRVEVDKIKSKLDQVSKEKMELQNRLLQQLEFQKQFESERSNAGEKADLHEIWIDCEPPRVYTSETSETSQDVEKYAMTDLSEKIKRLELELSKSKQENAELQGKSKSLQQRLDNMLRETQADKNESARKMHAERRLVCSPPSFFPPRMMEQITPSATALLLSSQAGVGFSNQQKAGLEMSSNWSVRCLSWMYGQLKGTRVGTLMHQMGPFLSTNKENGHSLRLKVNDT